MQRRPPRRGHPHPCQRRRGCSRSCQRRRRRRSPRQRRRRCSATSSPTKLTARLRATGGTPAWRRTAASPWRRPRHPRRPPARPAPRHPRRRHPARRLGCHPARRLRLPAMIWWTRLSASSCPAKSGTRPTPPSAASLWCCRHRPRRHPGRRRRRRPNRRRRRALSHRHPSASHRPRAPGERAHRLRHATRGCFYNSPMRCSDAGLD